MATTQLSQDVDLRAREIESLLLSQLLSVGQKNVAAAAGLSEAAITNWKKEGLIERFSKAIAAMDLQVVPASCIVVTQKYLESVETLAELGLRAEKKRPGPLGWD